MAIKRAICFHNKGHQAGSHLSNNPFIMINGLIQIVLSQIPNFHKLSGLSIVAAIMSFAYSSIGLGLSIAKIAGGLAETSLTGIPIGDNLSSMDKMWNTFSALGNMAVAYAFSLILIEIQDTLKFGPPENKVMKQATTIGISIATIFYMTCGLLGYAAFGNNAPGNLLTGFGFYEPFWLIDLANSRLRSFSLTIHFQDQKLDALVKTHSRTIWSNLKRMDEIYFDISKRFLMGHEMLSGNNYAGFRATIIRICGELEQRKMARKQIYNQRISN